MSAWSRLTAPLRRARWKAARWSTDSDRAFHDALFAAGQYDPFTFSYPGYLTIRRFADLAEQKLRGAQRVLDLGCGPGEITCELARRQPAMRFTGVDHSSAAITRATAHASRLGLTNVEFLTSDLETFAPAEPADAVLMFDAFHHLLQPWPVEICGTVAGLQEYGPQPFASSPVREQVGELTYDLIVKVEEMLRRFDADLAAKHWTV